MRQQSIWSDLKSAFSNQNNAVTQIILVNIGIFLLINIIHLFLFLFKANPGYYQSIIHQIAVPAHLPTLLHKPWTLFTYMFLHEDLLHILFNMLMLYWFGMILREYLGNKKILPVYILGGLFGVALYIISFNVFPAFSDTVRLSYALGASAGVLAIVVAAATLLPDYTVFLLLLGPVKLKWIAIVAVLIDLISIRGDNSGGHIAHIGGAFLGFILIKLLKSGTDLTSGFTALSERIGGFFDKRSINERIKKSPHVTEIKKRAATGTARQKKIDIILDKIAQSGYDSLTKEEKEFLFEVSKDK